MVENEYGNLNVMSKTFLGILTSIAKRKSNPLVNYLIKSSSSAFSEKYRHLTLGLSESDISEYTEEEKELFKETISFTPSGKKMLSDNENKCIIYRKYRQTGSIGSVLKQLVEWDSRLVKTDTVTDSLGNTYLYDKNYKFYFDNKKNLPIFFDNDDWIVSRKNIEYKKTRFTDAQYEELVNDLKSELCKTFVIEEVSGSDIVKFYLVNNYSDRYGKEGGTLFSSCMRNNSNSEGIKFYSECPNVKMIIVKDDDKILGRAMLFKTNVGYFMDRRYYVQDFINNMMVQYAVSKKYNYKTHNNYSDNYSATVYNYLTKKYDSITNFIMHVEIPEKFDGNFKYPYMDTFDKLYPMDCMISNYYRYSPKGYSYKIKSTSMETSSMGPEIRRPIDGSTMSNSNRSKCVRHNDFYVFECEELRFAKDFEGKNIPSVYMPNQSKVNNYNIDEVEKYNISKK